MTILIVLGFWQREEEGMTERLRGKKINRKRMKRDIVYRKDQMAEKWWWSMCQGKGVLIQGSRFYKLKMQNGQALG